MPRTALFVVALACLACSGGERTGEVAPSKAAPEAAPEAKPAPAPEPVDAAAAPDEPEPPPAWFSPGAFEHAAIVRQDKNASRLPSGQSASMIVLELPAGTTAEQCIELARARLGESIPDLPEASPTPQGYLELRGKTETYDYTVVCGVARDKPTIFLSYLR